MEKNIGNNNRYSDLEEFIKMEEIRSKEINKLSEKREKINRISVEINKKENKLSKISKLINKDMTPTKNQVDEDMINLIKNKINKYSQFDSLTINVLFTLYLYILKELDDKTFYYNFGIIYNQFKKYKEEANKFIQNNNHIKQHSFILLIMKKQLVQSKLLNEIIIDETITHFINGDSFLIFDYANLREETNKLIQMLNKHNNNIIEYLEKQNDISKIKKTNIIKSFTNKFVKTYDYNGLGNKPEILLYNLIVEFSKSVNEILFVTHQCTLPVSNIKLLSADILVVLQINGFLHFCVIEYDGPTHYNIKDFRFNTETVKRDTIKNNFCIKNNISILRIKDKNKNINKEVIDFINEIIGNGGKPSVKIPNDKFYEDLIMDFNNYSKSVFEDYIINNKNNIKTKKIHNNCISFGCDIYNKKIGREMYYTQKDSDSFIICKK